MGRGCYTRGMDKRVQNINGDKVLEITSQEMVKTRVSENELLRKQTYLIEAITKFQANLDEVNAQLTSLYNEEANIRA